MDTCDVLVIGAGLAGLRCAALLAAHGRDVWVWEAADQIGGRVRTDVVDGFRCDRGFQVLNPAYPELQRAVDVSLLKMQSFDVGVGIRRENDSTQWVHPVRVPRRLPAMVSGGGIGPRDVLALARWAAPALRPKALKSGSDTTVAHALDRCGVGGLPRRVVERFLAVGAPGLPADGMQALPRMLAEPIRDRITLDRRVIGVDRARDGWTVTTDGNSVHAREVVIATDPVTAATLTGAPPPRMHGVVTDWWTADQVASDSAMLWVDGRTDPPGPVLNTAVISTAAPAYAPPGRHLIAASALLGRDGHAPDEPAVRAHAADILGEDSATWTPLIRHVIPQALPAQLPPLQVRRPIRTDEGLWVCGDHRDTASIQGALVSGRRTAAAVLAHG